MSKISIQENQQSKRINIKSQIRRQQACPRKQRLLEKPDLCSSLSSSTISETLLEDDVECASFLLILKYRISPNIEKDIEKMKHYRVPVKKIDDKLEKSLNIKEDECFVTVKKEDNFDSIPLKKEACVYNYETVRELLGESDFLAPEDFVLVPDYIFYAMAQMNICHVEEADRVGCYKTRPLGFAGMCCKHCGGRPGNGKYFPATIRGLAQTTTTHTIIKHVAEKCRHCPPSIRQRLLEMQKNCAGGNYGRSGKVSVDFFSSKKESIDHNATNKPKYGSRKVFFERLWARLSKDHIPKIPKEAFLDGFGYVDHEEDNQEKMGTSHLGDDRCTSLLHSCNSRKKISKTNQNEKSILTSSHDKGLKSLDKQAINKQSKKSKATTATAYLNNIKQPNQDKEEKVKETQVSPNERRGKRKRKAPMFYS